MIDSTTSRRCMQHGVSVLLLCALGGCSTLQPKPTLPEPPDPAMVAIARAANDIQSTWNELGAIERSKNPSYRNYTQAFAGGLPPGLDRKAVINWNGPIEPLVRMIAKDAGYAFEVIGTSPPIPVTVALINDDPVPLGYLLRDAGFQAGSRAGVIVDLEVIEIHYPE